MPRNIDFDKQPLEVRLAAHAIGLDHKRPYQRWGKLFYRPYRNYYTTPTGQSAACVAWFRLSDKQLAKGEYRCSSDCFRFSLTRAGLDWLGETLGITIYDERD